MRIIEFLQNVYLFPVKIYRKYISPLKSAPSCRFHPTCSEYAIDAVREWGIVVGTLLAVVRIIRCNPFSKGGFDPVPTRADFFGKMRGFFRHGSEKQNRSPRETSENQEN